MGDKMKKLLFVFMLSILLMSAAWSALITPVRTDVSGFPTWTDTNVGGTTYLQLLVAGANTITPAMNFDNFNGETLDYKARTYGGTNAVENTITIEISIDNGTNWTSLGTALPTSSGMTAQPQIDLSSYNGTQVKIRFSVAGTNNSIGAGIDDITISGTPLGASLSVVPSTLTDFTYVFGNGPSAAQSFALSGLNLTADVSVAAPTNYVIASSETGTYGISLSYTPSSGSVSETVWVKLMADLTIGSYNSETITCSTTGATNKTVTCSGSVTTPAPPTAPVTSAATAVGSDSFTANWQSVSGATGYYLDVYTKTAGTAATDLIISEYVEGSSSNKYIEIYNGTGSQVDLSDYYLRLYSNGATSPTNDIQLSGTLDHGSAIVYKNSGAVLTLPSGVTATTNAAVNFNGDDAVALYKVSTTSLVDIFGMIGQDPGTQWIATGGYSTLDKTLVRKSSVIQGITVNPSGYNNDDTSAFETLGTEWDVYDQNTATYLGSHTMSGAPSNIYVTGYEDLDVSNVTSYEITGLDPETTYYYVVRAYDDYSQTSGNSGEIEVSTIAATTEVIINADGTATGATIVSGGTVPPALLGADSGVPAVVYTITATGTNDVTVYRPSSFGSIDWYCWLNTPGGLLAAGNPIAAVNVSYVFTDVNFDAKGDVAVILNDNSTLPVELSSFTATINAHNYVQLTWVTQTETGVQGFYVYRSMLNDLGAAELVSNMIPATNTSQQQSYIFVDSELFEEGMYYYWLQNADFDGSSAFHGPVTIQYTMGNGNNGTPNIPLNTQLKAAYPNPFNPSTRIPYDLAKNAEVKISIYNSRGQLIRVFPIGSKDAGSYYIEWNGKSDRNEDCATGVYYIRMQAGDKQYNSKAVLIK